MSTFSFDSKLSSNTLPDKKTPSGLFKGPAREQRSFPRVNSVPDKNLCGPPQRRGSKCKHSRQPEIKKFTFIWTIDNPSVKRLRFDEIAFTDDHQITWLLSVYPSEVLGDKEDDINIKLKSTSYSSRLKNLSVRARISIEDDDLNELNVHEKTLDWDDSNSNATLYFTGFMKADEIFNYTSHDSDRDMDLLRIKCQLGYEWKCSGHSPLGTLISRRNEKSEGLFVCSCEFEDLLDSRRFADLEVVVVDGKFYLHKIILSWRSEVFAKLLEDVNLREIVIQDVPQNIMKEIFRYIYCNEVYGIEEMTPDLLLAACKYKLTGLKSECEKLLMSKLNKENVFDMLKLVDQCEADDLRREIITFIMTNDDITTSGDLKKLMLSISPWMAGLIMNLFEMK